MEDDDDDGVYLEAKNKKNGLQSFSEDLQGQGVCVVGDT